MEPEAHTSPSRPSADVSPVVRVTVHAWPQPCGSTSTVAWGGCQLASVTASVSELDVGPESIFSFYASYIQKTKIMASGPITSWQVDGETVETVADFIFLGSKITADGDCSHEIKRHLLLGRKL